MTYGAEQDKTATRPVAVFVMGMGRSGTSALTRVLSLCGGALPEVLLGANSGNPLGHWEPRAALDINEAILYRNGSNWFDPSLRLQTEGALGEEETTSCIEEVGTFFDTLPAATLVVIKEPRISALADIWFEAARQSGFDVTTVIAIRHPQEVVASLAARDRASSELSSALWLKYNLLSERHSRSIPRVFVEYTNLLQDWRRETDRIAAALNIDLSTRDEAAIDGFLTPDLRRQRHGGLITEAFGGDWISITYKALCSAARDEDWDRSALDRVYDAYRASENGFRNAFADFHGRFNGKIVKLHSLLVRPSVTKVMRTLGVMADRQ